MTQMTHAARRRSSWPTIRTRSQGQVAQKWASSVPFCSRWGIHLTQVTPRCSMRPRGGLPARSARVRGALRHRRGLSRTIWSRCAGGTGSVAPTVGLSELGRCAKYGSNVLPAVAKRPSRPVRSFRTHASRCGFGSEQCGTSSRRRTESAPWVCNAFWDWAATKPPGLGCTSCGGRWCGRGASV